MGSGSCGFSCNAGTTAHNNTCYACARASGEFNPSGSPDVVRRTIWQAGCDFDNSWKPPTNLPAHRPQTLWEDQGVNASTQLRVYHMNIECEDGYLLHESGNGCFRKLYRWVDTGTCSSNSCGTAGTVSRRCEGYTNETGVFNQNAAASLCPATAPTSCMPAAASCTCPSGLTNTGDGVCRDPELDKPCPYQKYIRKWTAVTSGSRSRMGVAAWVDYYSYNAQNDPNYFVCTGNGYYPQNCYLKGLPQISGYGNYVGENFEYASWVAVTPRSEKGYQTLRSSGALNGRTLIQQPGNPINLDALYVCPTGGTGGSGGSGGGSGGINPNEMLH
jgi:hypothetical protein